MQIIETEVLSRGRVKLKLEDGSVLVLYRKEVKDIELTQGSEITDSQYQEIREEILLPRVKKRAMYLLEKRDHTQHQLEEKLRQGFYGEDLIEEALRYVKRFHYIDDLRFAQNYVRYHGQQKSARQLRMELLRKGVPKDDIEQAMQKEHPRDGETAMIQKWIEKKHYDPGTADTKEKQKMYQFLMRRGFRSEDIYKCIM